MRQVLREVVPGGDANSPSMRSQLCGTFGDGKRGAAVPRVPSRPGLFRNGSDLLVAQKEALPWKPEHANQEQTQMSLGDILGRW